jgi:hypothetical protein
MLEPPWWSRWAIASAVLYTYAKETRTKITVHQPYPGTQVLSVEPVTKEEVYQKLVDQLEEQCLRPWLKKFILWWVNRDKWK